MSYSAPQIEVMRFFGRKGGVGIGCCAIDLIQGFVNDPDAKAAVKLVHGDSGTVLSFNGKPAWFGKTNHQVFLNYLRVGTFSTRETPNRMFLASLTADQCAGVTGQKWLKILKENGFEFIRAVDNSVYSGTEVGEKPGTGGRPIYLFGLMRNIGKTALENPFQPPKYWMELPEMEMTHNELWLSQKLEIMTEEEAKGTTASTPAPALLPA